MRKLLPHLLMHQVCVGRCLCQPCAWGTHSSPSAPLTANDGPGKYNLVGIISHLGSNTNMGHYVCHVKKKGVWYIFNDAKVRSDALLRTKVTVL